MAAKLPDIGVNAVVKGMSSFTKDIDTYNKKIADATKQTTAATKGTDPFSKSLDNVSKSVKEALENFSKFSKESLPFGDVIGGFVDKLAALPVPLLAAGAAIAALGKAFLDLGQRGAPLVGLAQSFDRLTASVGISSQTLLKDLRAASQGTVADFDLIRQANLALAGATGEFGKQFGEGLPKILELARIQARATGQEVDYLYQSLVTGIKRASPRLIDNTGIVLKISEANEAYAQSIGKTVEALSEEDKQIAVLNATLEAADTAINTLGTAQETNAEKIARGNATITNTLDALAVAVQPAYGTLLDAQQKVLDIVQQIANAIGPIFGAILQIVTSIIGTIVDVATQLAQPFIDAFSSIAPYVALVFQFVAKIIAGVGKIIGDVVGGIIKFLSDVGKNFFGLDLKNLGPQLFNGAAAAFGSFANGIIAVANKLIFPAVIGIAKFIADFLIGFSPPEKGPLSVIDKGGENLMKAWLEGISGVSLDPVKDVAKQVSDALGAVGKESLKQVNKRLAELDKALAPFQNRLDIVKAQFDALNEPAKLALDAIDRQTAQLQDAVAAGDETAAAKLRILDQQRDVIQAQVDAQQGIVDAAQIQLTLAKAQQGPERALLAIRKAYLEALTRKKKKTTGESVTKEPKGTGASTPPEVGGAVTPISGGELPSVLDLIGGQGAVDAAASGLQDAFMGAIDDTNLQEFAQNTLDLGTQLDRIKSVDLGGKIADKFKGLTDAFNPEIDGSIANQIQTFVATLTGDASVPGSIASFFANLPQNISNAASGLYDSLKTNVFDPVINFLLGTGTGSITDIINQFVAIFGGMPALLVQALFNFAGIVYNAIVVPIINVMNAGIGAIEGGIRNIASFFASFLAQIIGSFDTTEVAGTNLGGLVPQALRDFQAGLASVGSSFSIGRISTELPSFLQAPGGATGGIFSSGLMKVGERGSEYMFNATKMGVLPHELVKVLTSLESVLAQPQPVPIMAGGNYDQSQFAQTNNFYGVQGASDVMRRFSQLRGGS